MSRPFLPLAAFMLAVLAGTQADAQFSFFGKKETPAPAIEWVEDPAEAIAEARRTGKPILAYLTSDHCGYCKKMEKETWSQPAIGRLVARGFVPLKLHAKDHPEEVAALKVKAFPTTVLISPQGKAFAGKPGFMEPLELAQLLKPALEQREVASIRQPAMN